MSGDPETMPVDIEHLDPVVMGRALDDLHALFAEDPRRWTQGALARTDNGAPADPCAADACRWCLLGASRMLERRHGLPDGSLFDVLDGEARRRGRGSVADINDGAGHVRDVLRFIAQTRKAIDSDA